MSLLVKDENTDTSTSTDASILDDSDDDDINSSDISNQMKPQKLQFMEGKDDCGIWYISRRTQQSKTEPKRSDWTVYLRLSYSDKDH